MARAVTPAAGSTLLRGRYLLRGTLGRGGAGVVWEAEDARDGGLVAVKLLPADAGGLAAAEREAEVAVRVRHPGVVRVAQTFEEGAYACVVMERCEESAADAVARLGPMAPARALALVAGALDALAAAHAAGVVHRDVKPGNLLLRADGSAALGDWGIARALFGSGATHTTSVALLGTLPYLAPELRQDPRAASPASDLYAAGVTLAWLCTGQAPADPFVPAGEDALRATLPPAVVEVVREACAWAPADRPPGAAAMAERCRAALAAGAALAAPGGAGDGRYGKGASPSRPMSRKASRVSWGLGVAGVAAGALLLAGVGAWVASRGATSGAVGGVAALPLCEGAPARFVEERVMGPVETIAASLADLDGDGRLEVIYSNQGGENLTLWWSEPGGLPHARTELTVGRVSGTVAAVDVDADGRLDLVVPQQDLGRFVVHRGLGERAFAPGVPVEQGPAPTDAWAAGPGRLAFFAMNALYVREREERAGAWSAAWPAANATGPVVVATREGAPWAAVRQPGGWAFSRVGSRPEDVATLDWPDGVPDLARLAPVWEGQGAAAAPVAWAGVSAGTLLRVDPGGACRVGTWAGSEVLAVADLDVDGVLDVVASATCAGCTSNQLVGRGVR